MKARQVNKTVQDVKQERDAHGMELINYGNSNRVFMEWNWSQEAEQDQMVRLTIRGGGDKKEVIIYAEEFMRYLRWA